jgi:hypothetical protein
MRTRISESLSDPSGLEKLYRENKREFERQFAEAAEGKDSELLSFWRIRLSYGSVIADEFSFAGLAEVLLIALLTSFLVKLPAIFSGISEPVFMMRDVPVIVFNGLIVYFIRQEKMKTPWILGYAGIIAVLLVYLNLLPQQESDPRTVAFIHSPLLLWCLFGAVYIAPDLRDTSKRLGFIRYNGELLTMSGLLLITGGLFSGITMGLFSAIGADIEKNFFAYVAFPGAAAAPVLAAYLIRLYPDVTRRIVPVIARFFTPIVLITLVIYLVSLAFSGAGILTDRNLLILFNLMLVAVLAIIIFSVTGLDKGRNRNFQVLVLFLLAVVTLVINSIALTAIIGRLADGLTPNRLVVLITNLLVFIHLILIALPLFRSYRDASHLSAVERMVAQYLTVYFVWTVVAIIGFPLVF